MYSIVIAEFIIKFNKRKIDHCVATQLFYFIIQPSSLRDTGMRIGISSNYIPTCTYTIVLKYIFYFAVYKRVSLFIHLITSTVKYNVIFYYVIMYYIIYYCGI